MYRPSALSGRARARHFRRCREMGEHGSAQRPCRVCAHESLCRKDSRHDRDAYDTRPFTCLDPDPAWVVGPWGSRATKATELALPRGFPGENICGPGPVDVATAEDNAGFASLNLGLFFCKSGKR